MNLTEINKKIGNVYNPPYRKKYFQSNEDFLEARELYFSGMIEKRKSPLTYTAQHLRGRSKMLFNQFTKFMFEEYETKR